jgi:hypothetical protein
VDRLVISFSGRYVMLYISTTATVAKDHEYGPKFTAGDIVAVDAIKKSDSASGFSVRVVGIWRRPKWFDTGWFKEFQS